MTPARKSSITLSKPTRVSEPHAAIQSCGEVDDLIVRPQVALLHGGFERRDGAVVESFTQRIRNWLARVYAFG